MKIAKCSRNIEIAEMKCVKNCEEGKTLYAKQFESNFLVGVFGLKVESVVMVFIVLFFHQKHTSSRKKNHPHVSLENNAIQVTGMA